MTGNASLWNAELKYVTEASVNIRNTLPDYCLLVHLTARNITETESNVTTNRLQKKKSETVF